MIESPNNFNAYKRSKTMDLQKYEEPASGIVRIGPDGKVVSRIPDGYDEIRAAKAFLLAIAKVIGIREAPHPDELGVFVQFIREKFPEMTMADVRSAFDAYAAGEIAQDVKHFGLMDKILIGRVLQPYRAKMVERERELRAREQEREEMESERRIRESADNPAYWRSMYLTLLKVIRGSGDPGSRSVPQTWDWHTVFRFLESTGRIRLTDEEKLKIREEVEVQMEKEAEDRIRNVGPVRAREIMTEAWDDQNIRLRCWKRVVREYVARFVCFLILAVSSSCCTRIVTLTDGTKIAARINYRHGLPVITDRSGAVVAPWNIERVTK